MYFLHISLCFTLVLTKGCTYSVIMDFTLLWRAEDLPTMIFPWKACTIPKQPGIAQASSHQHFCHLLSPGSFLSTRLELLVPVILISTAHLQLPAFPSLSSASNYLYCTLLEMRGPGIQGHCISLYYSMQTFRLRTQSLLTPISSSCHEIHHYLKFLNLERKLEHETLPPKLC